MNKLVFIFFLVFLIGCSRDRNAEEQHRTSESQPQPKAKEDADGLRGETALSRYGKDAKASCEAEIKKTQTLIVLSSADTTVRFDADYLTGERGRTRQQFPASEAFIVSAVGEKQLSSGEKPKMEFTCQVVCLNVGSCNAVAVKAADQKR